jgi:hypothetical protein
MPTTLTTRSTPNLPRPSPRQPITYPSQTYTSTRPRAKLSLSNLITSRLLRRLSTPSANYNTPAHSTMEAIDTFDPHRRTDGPPPPVTRSTTLPSLISICSLPSIGSEYAEAGKRIFGHRDPSPVRHAEQPPAFGVNAGLDFLEPPYAKSLPKDLAVFAT